MGPAWAGAGRRAPVGVARLIGDVSVLFCSGLVSGGCHRCGRSARASGVTCRARIDCRQRARGTLSPLAVADGEYPSRRRRPFRGAGMAWYIAAVVFPKSRDAVRHHARPLHHRAGRCSCRTALTGTGSPAARARHPQAHGGATCCSPTVRRPMRCSAWSGARSASASPRPAARRRCSACWSRANGSVRCRSSSMRRVSTMRARWSTANC